MEKYMNIIYGISNFAMVGIIFLVVLVVFTKLTLKKYQVNSSKIKFYGLFLGMDNRSVLAFSLVSVAYIFLVWCIATFQEMNFIYFVIVLILVLLSDILTKNYEKIRNCKNRRIYNIYPKRHKRRKNKNSNSKSSFITCFWKNNRNT